VQEDSSDQFLAVEVHYLGSILISVVLVAQPDRIVLDPHDAPVVEGGLAAVAAEVVHDSVWAAQISFGVDYPSGDTHKKREREMGK
jgi:hypothetical protein